MVATALVGAGVALLVVWINASKCLERACQRTINIIVIRVQPVPWFDYLNWGDLNAELSELRVRIFGQIDIKLEAAISQVTYVADIIHDAW